MAQTSVIHCPACLYFWDCPACKNFVRPKAGDCCVFCSYGSLPCPSRPPLSQP